MSRSKPPTTLRKTALAAIALATVFGFGHAHADEPAAEDAWWQAETRQRTAYFEAGIEVTVDDGNTAGAMGEAGNVELTTGFWWVPFVAAEVQVAVGRAVNPGVLADTRVASTHGGIGAGLRLGMPIRISPIFAAHIGYRQVLSEKAELTCTTDCATRVPVAMDYAPDEQVYGDAEAGVQFNVGAFSMSATMEYSRPFSTTDTTEAIVRGNPDAASSPDLNRESNAGELGFNLQAGVRF